MADWHLCNLFTSFTLWNSHFLTFLHSKLLTVLDPVHSSRTELQKVVIQERIQAQNRSENTSLTVLGTVPRTVSCERGFILTILNEFEVCGQTIKPDQDTSLLPAVLTTFSFFLLSSTLFLSWNSKVGTQVVLLVFIKYYKLPSCTCL